MAPISDKQIAVVANLALRDQAKTKIAVAIALAESGGDPKKRNNNPATKDDSYGLWQINMYGSLGPSRRQSLGLKSDSDLYDPFTNAKAMEAISSGGSNWTPWSVYNSGKYRGFLDRAGAVSGGLEGDVGNPIDDITGAINDLNPVEAFKALIEPLLKLFNVVFDAAIWVGNPSNWIRIIQVGGGVALALSAAAIVAQPTVNKYTKTVRIK